MQKSKIEWCTHTSNPIKGKCLHACSYCYAERIRIRFKQPAEVSWHPDELAKIEKRKKPATIFMGSMHDIFGSWVKREWQEAIIETTLKCPQHKFIFLTKNPDRYNAFKFPINCYLGATATDQKSLDRAWKVLSEMPVKNKNFISFEPLLEEIKPHGLRFIDGVIIGAQTGAGATKPHRHWVDNIIMEANMAQTPVFVKNNLAELYPGLAGAKKIIW